MIKVLLLQREKYIEVLAGLITTKIIDENKKLIFIDSVNQMNQYMFKRTHLNKIMENLFYTRTERFHDFFEQLRTIKLSIYYNESASIILSPYAQLLEDLSHEERAFYSLNTKSMLKTLSKEKEIILLSIKNGAHYPS